MNRRIRALVATILLALGVAACGGASEDDEVPVTGKEARGTETGSIFGEGGILGVFSDENTAPGSRGGGGAGLGVNTFLWRASLDTISFMPVASADPFGGVIVTDWFAAVDSPGERFKLNVYILGTELRADGVVVRVFRQIRDGNEWRDAVVPEGTGTKIEDAILTKARTMRNQTLLTKD